LNSAIRASFSSCFLSVLKHRNICRKKELFYEENVLVKLNRKAFFVIGILVIISAVAAWYFYPSPLVYSESFESDFGGWIADADVPLDPNNPGHPVDWNVSRVSSLAYSGQYSLMENKMTAQFGLRRNYQ
jgi:hypothetical protein